MTFSRNLNTKILSLVLWDAQNLPLYVRWFGEENYFLEIWSNDVHSARQTALSDFENV